MINMGYMMIPLMVIARDIQKDVEIYFQIVKFLYRLQFYLLKLMILMILPQVRMIQSMVKMTGLKQLSSLIIQKNINAHHRKMTHV